MIGPPRSTDVPPAAGHAGTLARNVAVNLAGQVAPAVAALIAIPVLARGLGAERLGVVNLAWVVIGYLSVFDIGIGRALTQSVAASLGARDTTRVPGSVWTAWTLLAALGLAAGAGTAAAAPWLAREILSVPTALQSDVRVSLYILAAAMPAITISSAARGVLEARQLFVHVNAVRVPLGVAMYGGPALVLLFTDSVVFCVAVMAAARAVAAVAFVFVCLRAMPELRVRVRLSRSAVTGLVSSGAWMTLANIAAALMLYADRFVVGGLMPIAAFAYYSTPEETILRVLVVPAAFSTVMFPAFSTAFASGATRIGRLFDRSTRITALVLFPVTFAIAAFAREILGAWLGPDFAANSVGVSQFFAAGAFVAGLAATPFAFLQAIGRARVTGVLQLVELPVYVGVLWLFSRSHGIAGAAAAWALRVLADTVILFAASRSSLRRESRALRIFWPLALGLGPFAVVALLPGLVARGAVFLLVMVAFAILGVTRLDSGDRELLASIWSRLSRRSGGRDLS